MDNDLGFISLLVDDKSIVNGLGEKLPISQIIADWAKTSEQFYNYLDIGEFPAGYSVFIPDFWHITHGQAKCLPKEDAERLWDSAVLLRNDTRLLETWTELVVQPCPGQRIGIKAGKVFGKNDDGS